MNIISSVELFSSP